jgi:uncharacterized membrane protein
MRRRQFLSVLGGAAEHLLSTSNSRSAKGMPLWVIPFLYVAGTLVFGIGFARFEYAYLVGQTDLLSIWWFNELSIGSAQASVAAIASGMIALTSIVFTAAYITAQFNSVAYSPRVALFFLHNPALFHTFGLFNTTFIFSIITLSWIDRENSGVVPQFSLLIVVVLLIASMLCFARLVRSVTDLTITRTLHAIGDQARIILQQTFAKMDALAQEPEAAVRTPGDLREMGISQTVTYRGTPRSITRFDIDTLVELARQENAMIELDCAVGDTLVYGTPVLHVRGGKQPLAEISVMRAISLAEERTFEQDPKYPIRLLVDIAIKALSPAINDPTTAVQAIDQLEDILHRLGQHKLGDIQLSDSDGIVRLTYRIPSWEDFLRLSFDEIRQYGADSVQVLRRLRSALVGLAEGLSKPSRVVAINAYVKQLDLLISRSSLDADDRAVASQEDRQGLGAPRRPVEAKAG